MSGSFTVGPRVEFDLNHYPRIRVWDAERGGDRYVYLHRLAAYAHGELDSLGDSRHVHHRDCDPWNNHPDNLEAMTPEEHDRRHEHTVLTDGGADPVDALEQYGTLYKASARTGRGVVHIREDCQRTKGNTREVNHPGELPLTCRLCARCDPEQSIDNRGGENPEITGGSA